MSIAFRFKIQIKEIKSPVVMRRLVVPNNFSFHHFHNIIQAAFGWSNLHLYEFSPKGLGDDWVITHPDSLPETEYKNSVRLKLRDYFFAGERKKLVYTYDFGDCWEHLITMEGIEALPGKNAVCIDGSGATPPEDCGGVRGYEEFKLATSNPKHKDYLRNCEWAGLSSGKLWDATSFNLERANRIISRM